MIIKPTIGRKVWFWPGPDHAEMNVLNDEQPLDATVVFVHSDRMVNLLVIDHMGHDHREILVDLIQPDVERPNPKYHEFCEWMDYQKKVAQA